MLTREPFNLSFEQIADLTDHQIHAVLFQPNPFEERERQRTDPANQMSDREVFERIWARRGLTPEAIAAKWKEENPDE